MANLSPIHNINKRIKLSKRFENKRKQLKKKQNKTSPSFGEHWPS